MSAFKPYTPIENAIEDKLGWDRYARFIANAIRNANVQERSVVIALHGDWGSGKSSLKNLSLGALGAEWKSRILEFNPWLIHGQENICEQFFLEVLRKIEDFDPKDAEQNKLTFKNMASSVGLFRTFNGVLFGAGKLAALGTGHAYVLPLLDTLQKPIEGTAKAAEESFKENADAIGEGPSLNELREKVSEIFSGFKKFLVVMDDLDRLTPEELRTVFQLVKGNVDFPNVVYLLLFQRDLVEHALGHFSDGSPEEKQTYGRNFLEKIVQAPLNVPAIPPNKISSFLRDELRELVQETLNANSFEETDLESTVHLMAPFFKTLRQLSRVIQTIAFTTSVFFDENPSPTGQRHYVLNPWDVAVLETVRCFEPNVFALIQNNSDYFLAGSNTAIWTTTMNACSPTNKLALDTVLKNLFPATMNANHNTTFFPTEKQRNEARVCIKPNFDNYFSLASLIFPFSSSGSLTVEIKSTDDPNLST